MSYILDALRRSEQERRESEPVVRDSPPPAPPAARRRVNASFATLALVAALAIAAGVWQLYGRDLAPAAVIASAGSVQAAPQAPAGPQAPAAPVPGGVGPRAADTVEAAATQVPAPTPAATDTPTRMASAAPTPGTRTPPAGGGDPAAQDRPAPMASAAPGARTPPTPAVGAEPGAKDSPAPMASAAPTPSTRTPPAPELRASPFAAPSGRSPVRDLGRQARVDRPAPPTAAPVRPARVEEAVAGEAVASPGPAAEEPLKFLHAMPDDFRGALPPLAVTIHIYAPRPADRILYINNKPYRAGDRIAEGLRVEGIVEDGAVLSYRGRRFKLPRPS